ncbi:hypothetical protein LVJ85_02970 [Neisseria sp. Dent CA1/247]|uniref:hypothetical protein n=1 Tax=Neisseria sp. Dent CA1/247 TaxID=2912675 RepID=UPI001FD46C6B|nr:hypothetical protein [Neisseria sp. Dent CA1/247]UOO77468.1 hypothetical protein LVJ85_02970 [Neisseria sp. Dent CA1/247]
MVLGFQTASMTSPTPNLTDHIPQGRLNIRPLPPHLPPQYQPNPPTSHDKNTTAQCRRLSRA